MWQLFNVLVVRLCFIHSPKTCLPRQYSLKSLSKNEAEQGLAGQPEENEGKIQVVEAGMGGLERKSECWPDMQRWDQKTQGQ